MRVGRPVAGPGRCATTTTSGVSVIAARLTPSTMSAKPPPEVATIAGAPANEAPIAMFTAAISSSACSAATPRAAACAATVSEIEVEGVIG